ncbi:MAG: hypothetical protein CBC28_03715 [Flavobacteriaceae bacterium TMED68]|nr:MAG: hypothetical protein CBC28_03715 [Flavobacteriaceae bacterium TMED68]
MKENHFRIEIFGIYPTKDDIELELLEEYNDRRDDYEISLRWNDNFLNEEIDELAKNNIFIEFLGDPSDYEAQYFKYKDEILPALFYVINNKICPLGVPDIDEDGISWDFYSIDGDWPESIAGVEFSLSSGYNTFDEAVEDYKKILSHYGYKNFKSLPQKLKLNR